MCPCTFAYHECYFLKLGRLFKLIEISVHFTYPLPPTPTKCLKIKGKEIKIKTDTRITESSSRVAYKRTSNDVAILLTYDSPKQYFTLDKA